MRLLGMMTKEEIGAERVSPGGEQVAMAQGHVGAIAGTPRPVSWTRNCTETRAEVSSMHRLFPKTHRFYEGKVLYVPSS